MPVTSHHVTRMTEMGDTLAGLIGPGNRPADKIFCKEIILVDGKALSNWLSYYLVREAKVGEQARGLGVHAHADLMNTHRFAPWAAALLRGEEPGSSFHDPLQSLELRVHAILSDPRSKVGAAFKDCVGQPELDGGMVRWEVSQRIASRLRELTLDDPEWTLQAQQNPKGDRLATLWKEVHGDVARSAGHDLISPSDVMARLEKDAGARETVRAALPGRIALLASGDIPRTLLRSLAALGQADDFNVQGIFLQPTLGYHLDVKKGAKLPDDLNTPGADFIRQTAEHFRNQFAKLVDDEQWNFGGEAGPEKPFPATLLGSLQQSIAKFDDRTGSFSTAQDPALESVAIHRCHSIVREAEVLRDELLKAMTADPTLRPRDILILSPDPETYASVLQGVLRDRGTTDIFLTHVALEGTGKSALASLAEGLLALPRGRCTAQEVMDLAELQVIRDRYRWDAGDTSTIKGWFKSAPFYWGADAAHRERLTEVAYGEWSLADFRSRLILGTALAPDNLLAGDPPTLPVGDVEGKQSAQLAAELIQFTDLLREWIHDAGEARPLVDWSIRFAEVVKTLTPTGAFYAEEAAKMERALGSLAELAKQATEEPVALNLFAAFAAPLLDLDHGKGQFMSGGAVLAPLRSSSVHPAKVIVLLGMKDGSFPVRGQSPGPELGTDLPLQSFRQKNQSEQRGMHAVLLAIGAAQSRLIATFPGYAGATGKEANAALPIELIKQACDRILKQASPDQGFKLRRHGIHAHEAASGGKKETCETTTFDRQAVAAAAVLQAPATAEAGLTINPSRPFETWPIDEWVEFWENPAKGLFNGLDLRTVWMEDELPADEALVPPAVEGRLSTEQRQAKYAAENWVKDYLSRSPRQADGTPTPPSREAAVLSGHFTDQMEDELDVILAGLETGPGGDWTAFITDYFKQAPKLLTSLLPDYHSTSYPQPYFVDDWLILTLPEGEDVKDYHLFPALALLAAVSQKAPGLKHVAVFGGQERTEDKKKVAGRGALAVQTEGDASLFGRLLTLAGEASHASYFLGKKSTTACALKILSGAELNVNAESFATEVFGDPPYAEGDIHDRFGRLLAPARFEPARLVEAMRQALAGAKRLNDGELQKLFKVEVKKPSKK
jgi:exodeoxyribonuclease V gamma subunit